MDIEVDDMARLSEQALKERFGERPALPDQMPMPELISSMVSRGSCWDFTNASVPQDVLNVL